MPVAEGEGGRPREAVLAERLAAGSAAALAYSRHRFIGTWVLVGVVAVLTGVALVLVGREGDTNDEQARELAQLADEKASAAQAVVG